MIVIVFYLWWHLLHLWDCVNHLTSSAQFLDLHKYKNTQIQKYKYNYDDGIYHTHVIALIISFHITPSAQLFYLHKYQKKQKYENMKKAKIQNYDIC